jgi:hypothetical protein
MRHAHKVAVRRLTPSQMIVALTYRLVSVVSQVFEGRRRMIQRRKRISGKAASG